MKQTAIIGSAMSSLTKNISENSFDLVRTTLQAALTDAGLALADVEAVMVTPPGLAAQSTSMFVSRLGAYFGHGLKALASIENGGCSSMLALRQAILEVASGRSDVAVAIGIDQRYPEMPQNGEDFASFFERMVHNTMAVYGAYDGVYGIGAPIPYYAMAAQRYMYEHQVAAEDLAWAAVRLREHANRNPAAMFYRKPLTIEDVLASPLLSPPLHLADCSQFVSGAACVVVVADDVAKAAGQPYTALKGWGQHHHPSAFTAHAPTLTSSPAVQAAAAEAFGQAGVCAADIDVAEIYGVFSSTELILCEDLGFFAPGTAGAAFREGRTTFGGDLVVDPSGGRLSLGHPACATPLLETHEIHRQLTGGAAGRQVDGARLGLVHAEHGMLNGSIVSVWERREP